MYTCEFKISMTARRSLTQWASLLFLCLAIFLVLNENPSFLSSENMATADESPKSIYDFTVKDAHGNDVPLSNYNGKVLLVVNVASKCGFTDSNYKELNVLYEKYKDQGFEILAFPCNQFGWQEPGTNEEILEAACTRFKAEFPIFEKIDVNGKNAAPLYKFLKAEKSGLLIATIKWNFTKFLVNKEGKVVERYGPHTSPLQFEEDIKNLLGSS
ncbi:probable glutathione peroxidase 2 isoform X1 [Coffea arabica]|uniref:Glutathione peroxidase n=2 Tax=Coffea arabica TaxID=13443 RepID=A0A6P6X9A2_COFAR|nr:probable glutathione peroxidase 2 isoform X2 [Coffea arabica]